ncbi:Reticulon-2 [Gossypium arboreum]|uniref:Reticulon-2 n=1 Tax=Gossypium arboreum TaxID=29729 RepID=A0A0B0PKB8_GOSAR|nr:Reticulon-2 [Gossypium arboreum]
MKLCLNEINLKLYRSRTKEIRLGSGKNKNSRIVDLHRLSISKILKQVTSSGIVSEVIHTIVNLRYF